MKKLTTICVMLLLVTGFTQAQTTKIVKTPFTPTFQILVKGAFSVPLSHPGFSDSSKAFPGAELELVYDFNPCWGVFGNFSADFISPKYPTFADIGGNYEEKGGTQLAGYVGPRYYINLRSAPLWKIYVDAGVGLYSAKRGDITFTPSTGTPTTTTYSFSSHSQMGTNLGAGANVVVGSRTVITFGARYHFVFKKTGDTFTITSSSGGSFTYTGDANERSYLQFNAGVGFRF